MSHIVNNNIMLSSSPDKAMKNMSDDEVLKSFQHAYKNGWDIHTNYGEDYSFYNALHACFFYENHHYKSAQWLLEKGIDPNLHSGNDNTAFTVALTFDNLNVDDVINFGELLKKYGANLSAPGYDDQTPIQLYERYNKNPNQKLIDYLIINADFENTFLLSEIFTNKKLLTFNNLKTILANHTIDLKKVKEEDNVRQTYWDIVARGLTGKYFKPTYEKITWLHEKIGFDIDSWHTYSDYDGVRENKYHINLLGLAIHNQNSNMFNWVLKRRPEFINDKFYINNQAYSLLEFACMCDFRKGIKLALKIMPEEQLMKLNIPTLKNLSKSNPRTLETLDKTFTALMYKKMLTRYENKNQSQYKPTKSKI